MGGVTYSSDSAAAAAAAGMLQGLDARVVRMSAGVNAAADADVGDACAALISCPYVS
jgi:hypothetical protein